MAKIVDQYGNNSEDVPACPGQNVTYILLYNGPLVLAFIFSYYMG